MTNRHLQTAWTNFQPHRLSQDNPDNCSGSCPVKIVKRLPVWINQQIFWTYYCSCCHAYQLKSGKINPGGFYD